MSLLTTSNESFGIQATRVSGGLANIVSGGGVLFNISIGIVSGAASTSGQLTIYDAISGASTTSGSTVPVLFYASGLPATGVTNMTQAFRSGLNVQMSGYTGLTVTVGYRVGI